MRQHVWLLALGITLGLAAVTWLTAGSDRAAAMPYASMEGKTLVLQDMPPKPAETAPPVQAPLPKPALTPIPNHKDEQRAARMKMRRKKNRAPRVPAVEPAAPAVSTQAAAVPAAAAAPAPAYTLDSIAERYENDPSDFSMDRATKAGDVTFRLLGLERLAEGYVLKVQVANDSASDFYVKGFVLQVGAKTLISRFFFRILVESQRAREGYVVFEKPQSGAAVKIKIEEEGGKGRALAAQIPYPF